jgi:hypothetical protein
MAWRKSLARIRRLGVAVAVLSPLFPLFAGAAQNSAQPFGPGKATASRTLFDCVDVLERRGGGWCELKGAAIADVMPF